jgi:hypothetical protein
MPVQDPTAGFVCYSRKFLETINLNEISFVGYAFQIEMKFAAWKLGFKIKEHLHTLIIPRLCSSFCISISCSLDSIFGRIFSFFFKAITCRGA